MEIVYLLLFVAAAVLAGIAAFSAERRGTTHFGWLAFALFAAVFAIKAVVGLD